MSINVNWQFNFCVKLVPVLTTRNRHSRMKKYQFAFLTYKVIIIKICLFTKIMFILIPCLYLLDQCRATMTGLTLFIEGIILLSKVATKHGMRCGAEKTSPIINTS